MRSDFRLHIKEITTFLKYVVIKFSYFEEYMNNLPQYVNRTDIDDDDKATWPYYRLMIGDVSLATTFIEGFNPNTQSFIELSPANLSAYPNMRSFYLDVPANFEKLLAKYPNDHYLIMRMFYPVEDIQAAIDKPDFSVLSASRGILDEYEYDTIMEDIDSFSQYFNYRWYMNTMEYEELYPMVMWSMLWYLLPMVILTSRIQNLRTFKVHPFYIWEYLVSRGYANYKGYFTRNQEHFLYRNDDYLQQNVGKKFVLDILQKEFLAPIKHTLKEKVLVCHTEGSEDTGIKYSDVLNMDGDTINYGTLTEFDTFLTSLYNHGYDPDNTNEYKEAVKEEFQYAPTNRLYTKFLELRNSSMNEDMMILVKFLIDSFNYLVSVGRVDYRISVQLASTGASMVDIPIIVALNLMYYCIYKETGQTATETIKYYTSTMALTHTEEPEFPTKVFVDLQTFDIDAFINISDAIGEVPYCEQAIFTSDGMSSFLSGQFDWLRERINTIDTAYDSVYHAGYLALYETLVPPVKVLDMPQPYATFNDLFIAYPEASDLMDSISERSQYNELYLTLFEQLIPLGVGFAELANDSKNSLIVEKMKELFTYLTSYNITFLTSDIDRVDIYRIPPLVFHLGRTTCSFTINGFGDPMNHGDYQVEMIHTGGNTIYDILDMQADVHQVGGSWIIETEEVEQIDTIASFLNEDIGNSSLYFEDFGNTIEIELIN